MESGVCGDEAVRPGGGGESEVQGIGWLYPGGGAEVGKALGDIGGEGDEAHSSGKEEAPVFCGGKDVTVLLGDDQDLGEDELVR